MDGWGTNIQINHFRQNSASSNTLRTYKYFHFKTTFMCPRSIAGVPSSQALPGYLITAPPFVCVPAVIGVLACGFQTKKNQINIWLQHYWTAASPTGLTERGEATGPTGDQAESKRASSRRPDLPVSISPAAGRAQPSAITTQKAHFAFFGSQKSGRADLRSG
jgi:hypothetical protein